MQKIIYTKKEIRKTAGQLLRYLPEKSCVCISGPMGAGKTALIKALVAALGGYEAGKSPSFGIVNEYSYPDGGLLGYHFDFYRLKDPEEALDLGLEEYLSADAWIFMEWPEKIGALLPRERVHITLDVLDKDTRQLNISKLPTPIF
jgi:tRNA threonylcarbamoyladenosine biosynthesis protein TsaE